MKPCANLSNVTLALVLQFAVIVAAEEAQELRFSRRPTQLHDVSRQILQCNLSAERVIRQQRQIVDKSDQVLKRHQERTLTILAIEKGRPTKAQIDYGQSSTHVTGAQEAPIQVTHPVATKTYFAELRGEELSITNAQGQTPTPEELEILRLHLATFGKPNPLAKFLHGKRIRVGDSLVVPEEVAKELLGLTGNRGKTDQLSLKLVEIRTIDGNPCGIFETVLRTANSDASMTMLMQGRITIEAATCRTKSIDLNGPVAMSEARGPAQGRFVVSTNGTLGVAVQATFSTSTQVGRATGQPSIR